MKPSTWRQAGQLILATCALNLFASVLLAILIRPGTLAGGALPERMAYISSHHIVWTLGWSSWIFATLSLVLLFYALLGCFETRPSVFHWLPVIFTVLGAVPDNIGVSLQLIVLPQLAGHSEPLGPRLFELMDRLSVALTGGLNNFWYGLAFFALVPVLRRGPLPRRFAVLSLALGTSAMLLSLASFLYRVELLVLTTALTMGLFVVWSLGLGWHLVHADAGERG